MQVSIGKSEGKNVSFDLDVLLRTRLLIQANLKRRRKGFYNRLTQKSALPVSAVIANDTVTEL